MSIVARPPTPPIDFTVAREDWSRYDLSDNSILKVKIVLTRIRKQGNRYSADFQNIIVLLTNERGNPTTRPFSPQEIQAAIIQDDIRHTTIHQDWNEYVADDGTKIKIQPMIMRIAKTSLFDSNGEPVYNVDVQATVQIRPPNPSI